MAITRANAEVILIRRLGTILTEVGLDGTTVDGSNPDLNDPIGVALRKLGHSVASITAVADADLVDLVEDDYDEFLDLAELRTLESIEGNLALVDITMGPRSEKFSQLATHVRERKDQLLEKIREEYGVGVATIEAGYVTLDFAEHEVGGD